MTVTLERPAVEEAPDAGRERGWYVDQDGFIVLFMTSPGEKRRAALTPIFSETVQTHNFRVAVTLSDLEEP